MNNRMILDQNGQCLSIEDEQLQLLGGDLLGRCIATGANDEHGYAVFKSSRSLLRSPEGFRLPNAGCAPILKNIAARRGIDLRIRIAPAIRQLPEPELTGSRFPSLANFAHRQERGLVRTGAGVRPAEIIADLASAYPEQRIIALCDNVAELVKISDSLAPLYQVMLCTGSQSLSIDDDDPMPRIVLSTFFSASEADLPTSDIVLLLDAYDCVQQRAQLPLSQIDASFRLFGIAKINQKVSPAEADMTMAVFGPEACELNAEGRWRREAHVAFLDHQQPLIKVDANNKRYAFKVYWENKDRNLRVQSLARAIRSDSPMSLAKYGRIADFKARLSPRKPRVTILVDRPIHAVELADQLPEWDVYTGDVLLQHLPRRFRKRANRPRRLLTAGEQQIVLTDAANDFSGDRTDIVIWASGGAFIDAIPDRWLHANHFHNDPLLILDFNDDHHPTACSDSRARARAYFARDIYPPGVSVANGRIAKFLRNRPSEVSCE